MTSALHVGIVGLGSMGRPMARNLIGAGHRVSGFDISASALLAAASDGVLPASSPATLAAGCDVVLTMVWDDRALRDVVFGAGGLLSAPSLSAALIDLSTTSTRIVREIGDAFDARSATFLDAAVIGGGVAAVLAGRSPMVASGDRGAFERLLGVLAPLGTCDYVGPLGNAKTVKILNNFLVGVVTASNAEALSLGAALGLDVGELVGWLRDGPATSRVLESYMGRYVAEGRYPDGLIGHDLMAKDIRLAAELAESLDYPATFPRFVEQLYLSCGRSSGGHVPFPAVFEHFRRGGASSGATPESVGPRRS